MGKIKSDSFNPLPIVPTVLVGANVQGKPNYMTVGFVSGVNINPAIVGVSLNKNHHTPKGITQNSTFSINIPSASHVEKTDYCGLVSGKTTDKSNIFTSFYGELGTAPMIEEFPIVCECKYIGKKVEFAMDTVYFGEIHQVYIDEEIMTEDKTVDIIKANPLILGMDNLYRMVGDPVGQAYHIGLKSKSYQGPLISERFSEIDTVRLIEQPVQPTLTIGFHRAATQREIAKALFAVIQYSAKLGIQPSGAPFVAYHGMNINAINMEVGFPFAQTVKGKGNIQAGEILGGQVASCIYVGPYEQLRDARVALNQWILKNGYEGTGVTYEFYLNDPQKTPPAKLETEVIIPLKLSVGKNS